MLDNDDGHRYDHGVIRRGARCVRIYVEVGGERRIALASLPSPLSASLIAEPHPHQPTRSQVCDAGAGALKV